MKLFCSLLQVCGRREYNCYYGLVLLGRKNISCTLLDSVLESLQSKLTNNKLAKEKTDFYSSKDTLEFTENVTQRGGICMELEFGTYITPY